MSVKTRRHRLRWLITLVAGTTLYYLDRRVKSDRRRTLAWLRGSSQLIQTERGAIEYAVRGQGRPLLYLHGGMGGFEQGLALQAILALDDYQVITLSRPGYRRSAIEFGGSLADQADLACRVMNHLGIERASIVGLSAGGLAALQLAQNHPERCESLILLSAHGPELVKSQPSQFWLWLLDLMLASDQLVWLLMGPGMTLLTRLMRVQQLGNSLPAIKAFFAGVFPSSDWRAGTQNDLVQLRGQDSLQPEQIAMPTLILHGLDDVIVPPAVAENSAARIPAAHYIRIEGGSHMMMATHAEEISRLMRQFLAANLD